MEKENTIQKRKLRIDSVRCEIKVEIYPQSMILSRLTTYDKTIRTMICRTVLRHSSSPASNTRTQFQSFALGQAPVNKLIDTIILRLSQGQASKLTFLSCIKDIYSAFIELNIFKTSAFFTYW